MKTWVDYRIEEMEEKSGLNSNSFPKFDMDGARYQADTKWNNEMEDAYIESISFRLDKFIDLQHY